MPLRIIYLVMATNITIPNSSFFQGISDNQLVHILCLLCPVCTHIPLTLVTSCIQQRRCFSRFLMASYYKWQGRVVTRKLLGWWQCSGVRGAEASAPALRENSSSAQCSELTKEELCCIAIRVCFKELRNHWMTAVVQRVFLLKVDWVSFVWM